MILPEYSGHYNGTELPEEFQEYHEVDYLFNLAGIDGHKFGWDLIHPEMEKACPKVCDRILVINGPISDIEKELRSDPRMEQYLMPILTTNSKRTVYEVPLNAEKLDKITVNLEGLVTFRNTHIGSKLEKFYDVLKCFTRAFSVIKNERLAVYQTVEQAGSEQYNLLIIPFYGALNDS